MKPRIAWYGNPMIGRSWVQEYLNLQEFPMTPRQREIYINPRADYAREYVQEFTMPEQMEVNLLRARVRELEKGVRRALQLLHPTPTQTIAPHVVEQLEDLLATEVKCMDLVAAHAIADEAVRGWEQHNKALLHKREDLGSWDQMRTDLTMRIAERIRGAL